MEKFEGKRQRGQIQIIPMLMGMLLLATLILGLAPVLNTVSSQISLEEAMRVYALNGYTAYASPSGTFYINNLLPNSDSTYDIGASGNEFAEGHFDSLYLHGTPPMLLEGSGKVYFELRPDLDFESVRANGKPTQVGRGVIKGWSLPIYSNDNEELFFGTHTPHRWDGASDILIHIHCYLDTANDGKNFNLQLSWMYFTNDDVIPGTSHNITMERATGAAAQYQSFHLEGVIDYDIAPEDILKSSDELHFRLRRLAASENEIAGEIVVTHIGLVFLRDKLGSQIP